MGMKKFVVTEPSKEMSETGEKKIPYPKGIIFIVLNEFCERFSYYGMRTILSLYLLYQLHYTERETKSIYHAFSMLVYFFPVLGAIISDSWLGKFRTILYVGIIYAMGNIVLSLSTIGPLGLPPRETALTGMMLLAIGTGGIKPCVASFGGDQFRLPQQAVQLARFFSIFYFSINAGSFISTMLTPVLREKVHCFGADSCFPLAFGVPGILMIASLVIFLAGKPLYTIKKPEGNIVVKVSKCIGHAVAVKAKNKGRVKKDHWLDHADDKYDEKLIADIKAVMRVLILYIPIPVFWALFDQQGSGWTFQATHMNGELGDWYVILPDQMQVINPLLILAFVPLFDYVIYPLLAKCGIRRPLQKLSGGMLLAALSFAMSAILENELEKTYAVKPEAGEAQWRLYNPLPCTYNGVMQPGGATFTLHPYSMYAEQHLKIEGETQSMSYKLTPADGSDAQCVAAEVKFNVTELSMMGHIIGANGTVAKFADSNKKTISGSPLVRTVVSGGDLAGLPVVYKSSDGSIALTTSSLNYTKAEELKPDMYTVEVGNKTYTMGGKLRMGGVYVIMLDANAGGTEAKVAEVTPPNSMHILWLVPQYIVITMGEVMFSVTGLEFSYSQAPQSMKAVLQACWLLTTAFGNFVVVVIENVLTFESGVTNYSVYASLMVLCTIVFSLLAMRYKYVVKEPSEIDMTDIEGKDNKAFKK